MRRTRVAKKMQRVLACVMTALLVAGLVPVLPEAPYALAEESEAVLELDDDASDDPAQESTALTEDVEALTLGDPEQVAEDQRAEDDGAVEGELEVVEPETPEQMDFCEREDPSTLGDDAQDPAVEVQSEGMIVSDPRVVSNPSMVAGKLTTWDCVWFGSYPQSEVTSNDVVYTRLESADWIANDVTVDGVRYHRFSEDETCRYYRYEPIKWRVLEVNGDTAFVVADVALDARPYDDGYDTWDQCSLRFWLNLVFRPEAFSSMEQRAIQETDVVNADNMQYGQHGGNDTKDMVFLLSESEVYGGSDPYPGTAKRHGFSLFDTKKDEARRCDASDYALAMGATAIWWLRSPGHAANYAAGVNNNGFVNSKGYRREVKNAVRPALNLNLLSDGVIYAGTVSSDGDVCESYRLLAPNGEDDMGFFQDCVWDDDWVSADSTKYNHEMARTMSMLASAAYEKESVNADLSMMGCSNVVSYYPTKEDYEDNTKGGIDQVGYCIGTRTVKDKDGQIPVVFVLIRGTTRNIEWESNFNVADTTHTTQEYHEGFKKAADQVFQVLWSYVSNIQNNVGGTRFVVTGHSRGAAVANLVGAMLDDWAAFSNNQVYVYTFASPNVSTASDLHYDQHNNIFNIVNPEDFVPRLPLSGWGYGRFGITKVLPSKSNTGPSEYQSILARVRINFGKYTYNEVYTPYAIGTKAAVDFEDTFFKAVPTVGDLFKDDISPTLSNTQKFCLRLESILKKVGLLDTVEQKLTLNDALHVVGDMIGELGAPVKKVPYNQCARIILGLVQHKIMMICRLLVAIYYKNDEHYDLDPITTTTEELAIRLADADFNLHPLTCFMHAHDYRAYVAWMYAGTEKELFEPRTTRDLIVACPVDVRVYDENNGLVCQIADGVVDQDVLQNGLAAEVVGDEKRIDIPSGERYRVEVTATDKGTMDISCKDMDIEGNIIAQVAYSALRLDEGDVFDIDMDATAVDDAGNPEQPLVNAMSVSTSQGEALPPTSTAVGGQIGALSIDVEVGEGDGRVEGSTMATLGDPVTVYAFPMNGASFKGWFADDVLVSTNDTYTLRADADTVLVAKFGKSIAASEVTGIEDQAYTGSEIRPELELQYGGQKLVLGEDYDISYEDNVDIGTAYAVVSGKGELGGTIYIPFNIVCAPISRTKVSGLAKNYTYTGKAIEPKVTVADGSRSLVQGTDYKLSYKKNVNAGTATMTVTGIGNYTGSVRKTFKIAKAANPMKVKAVERAVKASKVKKKAQVVAAPLKFTKKAKGKVTYARVAKGSSKLISVNKKTGKVTVAKGTKKGTYKVKIKVTAAGTANYKKASKTLTCTVVVK